MTLDFNKLREMIGDTIANNVASVNETHSYSIPVADLDSWPAVYIVPGNNEAEYASTAQDKHTYLFTVLGFYRVGQESYEDAEKAVGDTISDLINHLTDDGWIDRSIAESAEPVPSEWRSFDNEDGRFIGFSIEVRVVVRLDN